MKLYIEGYFTDRWAAGDRPQYGYPAESLPEVGNATMTIVSGFMKYETRK